MSVGKWTFGESLDGTNLLKSEVNEESEVMRELCSND